VPRSSRARFALAESLTDQLLIATDYRGMKPDLDLAPHRAGGLRALELVDELVAEGERGESLLQQRANLEFGLYRAGVVEGDAEGAVPHLRRAVEHLEEIAAEFPDSVQAQISLAVAVRSLSDVAFAAGDLADAERLARRAVGIETALDAAGTGYRGGPERLRRCRMTLAQVLATRGRVDEAFAVLEEANADALDRPVTHGNIAMAMMAAATKAPAAARGQLLGRARTAVAEQARLLRSSYWADGSNAMYFITHGQAMELGAQVEAAAGDAAAERRLREAAVASWRRTVELRNENPRDLARLRAALEGLLKVVREANDAAASEALATELEAMAASAGGRPR